MIKRLKKNIKETKPAVDAHKTILYPLDYSFKAISEFSEVLLEKPRGRDAKFTGVRFFISTMASMLFNVVA